MFFFFPHETNKNCRTALHGPAEAAYLVVCLSLYAFPVQQL